MNIFLQLSVLFFGVFSFFTFIKAIRECKDNDNAFGRPYRLCEIYGSFVWADHVVFGFFWVIISGIVLLLQDFLLFLLIASVFWLVRSIGETIYWFLQQFHPRKGNDPKKFIFYPIFKNDSVWFINQIAWQCVTVLTFMTTLYLSYLWIKSL